MTAEPLALSSISFASVLGHFPVSSRTALTVARQIHPPADLIAEEVHRFQTTPDLAYHVV
jgi:hypothetical protein